MNSALEPEWPAATVQYRLNLSHALHSISPAISALHIARAAALHPEISSFLQPTHCPKCSTYRYSGDHSSSLVGPPARKKRRSFTPSHAKPLQIRCRLCSFSIDARTSASFGSQSALPSDTWRAGAVPVTPRAKETGQDPPPGDVFCPTAGTVQATQHVPTPPLPTKRSHTKSSHTSTLKDMLSRDRQREEVMKCQKKKKEGREGLAAFLREL